MRFLLLLVALFAMQAGAAEPPTLSTTAQDAFFNNLGALCGKAFGGTVTIDNADSTAFANKALVAHVRECGAEQIKIPFHVGEDASRTWIITKTGSGLSLKHDHRHEDGSNDSLTMYGGHTREAGWATAQSFPADAPTQQMFTEQGIPQSNRNIWQIFVYPDSLTYRLIREGREFRVDFDLTEAIQAPAAPWGYE